MNTTGNKEMSNTDTEQIQASIDGIKSQLYRIHHQINNPLSVISGNVQLLQELARVLGVQDDFSGPLADIVSAVDQLAESTDQLMVTRNLLAQLYK